MIQRRIPGVGTLYFEYDLAGRRTMVQDWTGAAVYYDYGKRGLISEVHSDAGWTYYAYDARGAMLVKELPNGTVTYHSYDAAGRVTAVEDRKTDGTAITTFAFTRDPNANILTSLREDGSCWYYAYDGMQRLTKAEWKDGASLLYGYQYNYDKVGNRLSLLADGTVGCYSYNNCNELTDELCGSEEVDYDYDGRGNCVSRSVEGGATTYFEYNARNLVTRIDTTEPGFVPNVFTYNALGQRISKTDSTGTTYYVWDGLHILLEHDGAGTITRRYTYGHEAIHGVSGLIHVEDVSGDAHYFYHFDQVGGVRAVTTEAAATDTTYAYSPFGRILEESAGSAPNDFTFPATYIKLPDIGCLRLSPSRLCDTKVGRYMSRDPQRLVPTYPALQSNPLRLADPSGRDFLQALQDVAQVAGAFLEAVPQTWASGEAFDAWSGSVTSLFGIEGEAFYGNDAAYQLGEENPEIAGVAVTATAAAVSLMGVQAGTGFRIEIHGTHGWCWPHFQGIQGPGYGTTLGRFPPHTWPWPPWAGP